MYKEAIEIEKYPKNYNREDGWKRRNRGYLLYTRQKEKKCLEKPQ